MNRIAEIIQYYAQILGPILLVLIGLMIPISVSISTILFVAVAIFAVCLPQFFSKIKIVLKNPVIISLILFYSILLLSASYSSGNLKEIVRALLIYARIFYIPLFMLFVIDFKLVKRGLNAFLIAMLITLLVAFLKMSGLLHIGRTPGLGTLFANHIKTSFWAAFAAFIFLHRIFLVDQKKQTLIYLALFLLMSYFLFFMNEGRTGQMVFINLMALFAWHKWRWRGVLVMLVLIPLFAISLFLISHRFQEGIYLILNDLQRYQLHDVDATNSVGLRMQFLQNSLQIMTGHPLLGTGVGSFVYELSRLYPPVPLQNEFLLIGSQVGLIGLIAFLAIFVMEWKASQILPKELMFAAQGMIIAFLSACGSDIFLFSTASYFFIYFSALFFANYEKR